MKASNKIIKEKKNKHLTYKDRCVIQEFISYGHSFTSIANICAAVEALAERGTNGIYPIADDEMLSTNRLIELIAETCGKRAKLWRVPKGVMRMVAKLGDVLHLPLNTERIVKLTEDSFVNNSHLKSQLGWNRMPIRAEEGLRRTLRSFLAQ